MVIAQAQDLSFLANLHPAAQVAVALILIGFALSAGAMALYKAFKDFSARPPAPEASSLPSIQFYMGGPVAKGISLGERIATALEKLPASAVEILDIQNKIREVRHTLRGEAQHTNIRFEADLEKLEKEVRVEVEKMQNYVRSEVGAIHERINKLGEDVAEMRGRGCR